MSAALNPKQQAFVRCYLLCFNATEAAKQAGYSEGSAHVTGTRLLANAKVAQEIARGQQQTAEKYELTKERVLLELMRGAFANTDDFVMVDEHGKPTIDMSRLTRDQKAAIQSITIEE